MKRPHKIKFGNLENSIQHGSIQDLGKTQAKKIIGGARVALPMGLQGGDYMMRPERLALHNK